MDAPLSPHCQLPPLSQDKHIKYHTTYGSKYWKPRYNVASDKLLASYTPRLEQALGRKRILWGSNYKVLRQCSWLLPTGAVGSSLASYLHGPSEYNRQWSKSWQCLKLKPLQTSVRKLLNSNWSYKKYHRVYISDKDLTLKIIGYRPIRRWTPKDGCLLRCYAV